MTITITNDDLITVAKYLLFFTLGCGVSVAAFAYWLNKCMRR